MDQSPESPDKNEDSNSLESPISVVEQPTDVQTAGSSSLESDIAGETPATPPTKPPRFSFRRRFSGANIYLPAFILILVVSGIGSWILYNRGQQTAERSTSITSQELTPGSLSKLANSDVTVGDAKQVLTVRSNAIFAGKVLVQDDLEIAGKLIVGSSLSLTGVKISGQSIFDDVQVTRDISVTGNAAIQGKVTAKSLAVNGNGTFNGAVTATQLVANSLTLNDDLTMTHHIIAGGATPSRSNGGAVGSGGTTTVSGSDTAGTLTVNTGGSPTAGCFATINFTQRYNSNPHVLITPIGSAAAGVEYYVTRTTANFSICARANPPAGQSFAFDYFVIE